MVAPAGIAAILKALLIPVALTSGIATLITPLVAVATSLYKPPIALNVLLPEPQIAGTGLGFIFNKAGLGFTVTVTVFEAAQPLPASNALTV